MQRICLDKLVKWNEKKGRKPLVLMGARQVGKTWLMHEFATRCYPADAVEVNFMREAALVERVEHSNLDPQSLLTVFQSVTGKQITPGRTLLILDEIQECPRALTALKFFCEDLPELAVVAAGSLLGLSVGGDDGRRSSFPVGKIDRIDVHPMTYSEFLLAIGKPSLVDAIDREDWTTVETLSYEYEDALRNYYITGGMPEAVKTFAETRNLTTVREVQRTILADYDTDFKKHAKREVLPKIRLLWHNISAQLAKENKKFIYTALKAGARAREYETALQWLDDAGMVRQVFRVYPPELPIRSFCDFGAFKLYMHDVGLLGAMSGLSPRIVIEGNDLFTYSKGALTEQFVLEELVAAGIEPGYWTPDQGISEVDFVVQGETRVYPLEVKSATNTKAKSLGVYCRAHSPEFSVKSSLMPYRRDERSRSIPLYALGRQLPKELH